MQALFPTEPFSIRYDDTILRVHPMEEVRGRIDLMVFFSNNRKPIRIIRSVDSNGVRHWASLPEGRDQEADEVGKILEQSLDIKPVKGKEEGEK